MKLSVTTEMRLRRVAVVLCRLVVGLTFAVAGWAKAIDPWGFVIKVGEYLAVWNIEVPHELVVTTCITLACVEFCTGMMVLLGAFKRWSVWTAAVFMLGMLPLTAYIALADPVDDCGCFGDFIVLSNTTTFLKNVVISYAVAYLLRRNGSVPGLIAVPVQWIAMAASVAFPLYLAIVGYNVQPLVDFRPFKLGTTIFNPSGSGQELTYIYEKDGQSREFGLDALPDSSWTFVDAIEKGNVSEELSISVYDENGDDVSAELAETDQDCLYLVVADPTLQFLTRARFVNELADYASRHDSPMAAVIGVDGESLQEWKTLVRPRFPVYTAEDTSLKMLVRGTSGLVFTREGRIVWKRTLSAVSTSLISESGVEGNVLETIQPVDDGSLHRWACLIYLGVIIGVYLLGQSPKILPNRKK